MKCIGEEEMGWGENQVVYTVFVAQEAARRRRRLDMLTGRRCSPLETMKRRGKDEWPRGKRRESRLCRRLEGCVKGLVAVWKS